MNREMFIFMLIFAHFVGDYVFQSAWISEMKKTKFWPMIVHCFLYTGCIGFVLTGWLYKISWWTFGIIFLSHWLIDNFRIALDKSRKRIMWQRNFADNKFKGISTFVDQTLHFCVLVLLILKYC